MLAIGGAVLLIGSALPWGWDELPLPVLQHRFDLRIDLPWLAMVWGAGLCAVAVGALATRLRARTVLLLATCIAAVASTATAGAAHSLATRFAGYDSTDWSRYAPPGTPGPSHAFTTGFFVADAGLVVLLAALAMTAWRISNARQGRPDRSPAAPRRVQGG